MDRLFIIAPRGRDAEVVEAQLQSAGVSCAVASPHVLLPLIERGDLGAVIVTEEALDDVILQAMSDALARQPPWSDCPFIVLTPRSAVARNSARAGAALGNVTVLQTPMHTTALVSAAQAALRARARQRKAQVYLSEREKAEEEVRTLAMTLEARVEERTAELVRAVEERAAAQALLDESLANYRHTIELSTQIPWSSNAQGHLISIGSAWLNATGMTLDEVLGAGWLRAVHPDDVGPTFNTWVDAVKHAVPVDYKNRTRMCDGSYRWMRSRAAPRLAPDGSVVRWYGTVEDVHDQYIASAQLQQVQADLIHVSRLSAMGALATTLAHELNQPLASIANYVRGCRRLAAELDSDLSSELLVALIDADRSAVRAGEIVRRLRSLVSHGDVARHEEDVATLINEACGIAMVDAATRGVTWRTRFDRNATTVTVDRIQIQQVVINLLRNAVDAMRDSQLRSILIETSGHNPGFLEVGVHDSGPGLDEHAVARLFTPFSSGKLDGMGIGLSISRTIVEAHGGRIWYEPGRRGGAVFRFRLPRT